MRGRSSAGAVLVALLFVSCGDDGSTALPQTPTTAEDTTTVVATTAVGSPADEGAAAPGEDPEPGRLRTWAVSFTGDLAGDFAPSDRTDLSVSTAPPACSDFEVIVYDSPTRTSRVALIRFSVSEAIAGPGTFDLTGLEIGVVGDDGFSAEYTYHGAGTLAMTRYEGGAPEERRMTFTMTGSTADDSGGVIDVTLDVDWNDSCAR